MKKVVSVVAALVLSLAMGVTCFAASPVKVTSKTEGVTVGEAAAEVTAAVDTKEELKAVLGDKYTDAASVVAVFELTGTPGKVELAVTGISAGDSIVVLHWANGLSAAPEVLNATAGDGTVTFTASSFSPFAIVKLASAGTAPKTGDVAAVSVVALMLISAAGILVVNRRKFA